MHKKGGVGWRARFIWLGGNMKGGLSVMSVGLHPRQFSGQRAGQAVTRQAWAGAPLMC